jgi:hypothetical protein
MSSVPDVHPAPARRGLSGLDDVVLDEPHQAALDAALARARGSAPWRARLAVEARELLALAQIAPRLTVDALALDTRLCALVTLVVPVPVASGAGEVAIADRAALALTYGEEATRAASPGTRFVQVLAPVRVHHPNVFPGPDQRLCLGPVLPAGIPVKELLLMSYAALSMQALTVDPRDPAGLMNPDAARYWSANLARTPLTRAPFLSDPRSEVPA